MIKKIVNHSIIYAVLPKLPILMGFFLLPFITPYLTKVDYGIYGIVLSLVTGITVIKTLGLDVILMNIFIHHSHGRGYKVIWNEVQGFIFCWSIILGVITVLLLLAILPNEADDNIWTIILLTTIPIFFYSSLQIISQKYYQLAEKPIQIGLRALISGVINLGISYYLIVFLRLGYLGWIWSFFISETLMFLSFIYPIWIKLKLVPNFLFRRKVMKKYLKISLPLVPHTSAFFLLDFSDRLVMLNLGVSTSNIGLYDFSYKFAGYARVFSESIHQASTPLLIKDFKKNSNTDYLRNIIFLESYVVIFVSFVLALWLKEIFEIMVKNEDLRSSYKIGVILTMSYAYKPMYTAMATVFYYFERTKEFWKISFIAGLLNIVLNIILIPIYGFEIAVITTFFAFLFIGYSGFYITKFKKLYNHEFYPERWVLYTCFLLFLCYFAKDAHYLIKMLLTIVFLVFTLKRSMALIKRMK
ncbi:oligosaccharide flippase family protein [Formosa undariae]|uniref:Oligosaccharide flippase family protein n=1 Tax=Formosa undariae TaxID=1325436 RepID=A0ABV5EYI3_9FLAO